MPMTNGPVTFALIPGAGGSAWYWHRLVPELEALGHVAAATDLPAGDDAAGLAQYADVVVDAIEGREPVVLVAQSMGGLCVPLICQRRPVELIVLVNAMVPQAGESGGDWWVATGQEEARAEAAAREGRIVSGGVDMEDFFHDVPDEVVREAMRAGDPPQSSRPFADPVPFDRWPDVPTRVLVGRDDRFFPPGFQRRVALERLGIQPDVMPGGHLLALSQPRELARQLAAYLSEIGAQNVRSRDPRASRRLDTLAALDAAREEFGT
jgi:pimeloyl-ACP methyl ester carboxylesterase